MPVSFALRTENRGAVTVLHLAGELDMGTAPELESAVEALVEADRSRLLLQLAELEFCDSAGLNSFIRGDRRCRRQGGWLRITAARGHVKRVVELSGIDEVLVYRDES